MNPIQMSQPVGYVTNLGAGQGVDPVSGKFGEAIKEALDTVNSAEQHSSELNAALQRGEDVPIHEAMLAMQKATLSFQVMNAARNRLVQAYQTVSNMSI